MAGYPDRPDLRSSLGVTFGGSFHFTVTRRGEEALRAQSGRCGLHEPLPPRVSVGGGCQRRAAHLGKGCDQTPRYSGRHHREADRIGRPGRAANPRGSEPAAIPVNGNRKTGWLLKASPGKGSLAVAYGVERTPPLLPSSI